MSKKEVFNTRLDPEFKKDMMAESRKNKKTKGPYSPEIIVRGVCMLLGWDVSKYIDKN